MRYINLIIFILLSVFFSNHVFSDEKIITELRKGGKIIFIRHALAPGNGDPDNFSLMDCNTQRNLDYKGILLLQVFYASAGLIGMYRWFG